VGSDSQEIVLVLIDGLESLVGGFEFFILMMEGLGLCAYFLLERVIVLKDLECESDLRNDTLDDTYLGISDAFIGLFVPQYKEKKLIRIGLFYWKYQMSEFVHFHDESCIVCIIELYL